MIFAFAFPAVAQVIVMAEQRDHAMVFVIVSLKVRQFIAVGPGVAKLESATRAPRADVGHLRLGLQVIDQVENRV